MNGLCTLNFRLAIEPCGVPLLAGRLTRRWLTRVVPLEATVWHFNDHILDADFFIVRINIYTIRQKLCAGFESMVSDRPIVFAKMVVWPDWYRPIFDAQESVHDFSQLCRQSLLHGHGYLKAFSSRPS